MKNKERTPIPITILIIVLCAIVIIPFMLVISISFSNEADIVNYGYRLIPKGIDISAYKYVFANPKMIIDAYRTTAIFSFASMFLGVFLMSMLAYPLSRRIYKYRNQLSFILFFTMLFGGGMVSNYILITSYLNLDDTIWVYILPGLINPWSVFMIRTFFQGLPNEIVESAYVDGASEYRIFLQFILPLSKPILATIGLMLFLGHWNNWNTAMLFINNRKDLYSLQYLLQRIMNEVKLLQEQQALGAGFDHMVSAAEIPSETVRMAMAVVVAGPALFVFPFFQKYFTKGITLGSVKG